jgi:hypothetical protein
VKVTATTQVISFAWVVHGRCNSLGGEGREEKKKLKTITETNKNNLQSNYSFSKFNKLFCSFAW